jgi:hypothetical protein
MSHYENETQKNLIEYNESNFQLKRNNYDSNKKKSFAGEKLDKKIKKYSSNQLKNFSKEVILEKLKKLKSLDSRMGTENPNMQSQFGESGANNPFNNKNSFKQELKTVNFMKRIQTINMELYKEQNKGKVKRSKKCCTGLWEGLNKRFRNFNIMRSLISLINNSQQNYLNNGKSQITDKSLFSIDDTKYLIYPDSIFKKLWNVIIYLLLLYTAMILPFTICFLDESNPGLDSVELMIDILFALDIIINFFSAYYNEVGIIMDSWPKIISTYLRSWFIIDIIGSFPVQLLLGNNTDVSTIRIYKISRLLRMIKMVRVLKYTKILNTIFLKLKINLSLGKIISIFFMIFLTVHIVSCLWYYTIRLHPNDSNNWVFKSGLQDESKFLIYITAMYFTFFTIFTVGYGDIHTYNDLERGLTILWLVLGAGFYSYTIGKL